MNTEHYAKKFNTLNDEYRRKIVKLIDIGQKQYNDLASDRAEVSEHNFVMPEVFYNGTNDSKEYKKHLFVNEDTGKYKARLNS